jgi:hypothetical protein
LVVKDNSLKKETNFVSVESPQNVEFDIETNNKFETEKDKQIRELQRNMATLQAINEQLSKQLTMYEKLISRL